MTEPPLDTQSLRGAQRALRRMKPLEREIFIAIRFEDATYEDLAARLAIPVADVENHFASGIVTLVQAMRAEKRPWWKFWGR
ncbi:sigma factor-like helix-turn-helix DNA-binding protein [Sphingopyxis panaciterrulae]|uniref:RNA polymerase sigma-70 factor (ECF subfamily) n=1 Tax=Sphingopyxis panaciterrulae TaxID=462372 RepID=A0A7W9ESP5_9SPHN|nr:sigma-70 region 4 domain-containing protein [Sphingopyxis panaciterrulae]MBB5707370.1 RNA polymerase sigma-70 factor (ECF subfamily) [Sphingopyxis panaciterrulae]